MRVINCQPLVFVQRPFSGSTGVSLYWGYSASGIAFRRSLIFNACDFFFTLDVLFGAASFKKGLAAALVTSPTTTISASIPSTAWSQQIWVQLREFANDYENETIFRPQQITLDGSGNPVEFLSGTFLLLGVTVGDSGSATINFTWVLSSQSAPVAHFVAARVSGPTSPSPTSIVPSSARMQALSLSGLSTGTYVFAVTAVSALGTVFVCGSVTVTIPAVPTTTATLTYIED